MKVGARFLVMRYGTLIGRPSDGRLIVAICSRHWTADAALEAAKDARRIGRRKVWIVAVGQPAHRKATAR